MISRWRSDQDDKTVTLSRLNSSLGFYLPEGVTPKLVVVRNVARQLEKYPSSLEIRLSTDNRTFEMSSGFNDTLQQFTVDGKEVLVFETPKTPFRYMKLRYTSSDLGSVFKNRFASLLEVYGTKNP